MKMQMKNLIMVSALMVTSFGVMGESKLGFKDTLFKRQWAVENTGQSLLRTTGELTQEEIKGIPGVDIGLENFDYTKYPKAKDSEVVVAVLDSGLDINHPDLKGRIYRDMKLCPEDSDLESKPCSGMNILKNNLDLTDDIGHGTHVAGIIAANTNSFGVAGVTPSQVKILPVKVLSEDVSSFVYNRKLVTDWFADGIAYSLARGADVINMSIGWPELIHTTKMKNVLKAAAAKNVAVIVAAGNNNKQVPTYPCTDENVICVGAVDNRGEITEFSNFGGKVDVLAPGESIVSTYPQDSVESRILRIRGYEVKNGTSQAAPFVAALAATLKLAYPEITNDELRARIYSSAQKTTSSDDKFSLYGMINFKKALESTPKSFIAVNVKDLLEVNFDYKTKSFQFPIYLKSLIKDEKDVQVEVSFDREDIVLTQKSETLNLTSGRTSRMIIKGNLTDLSKDSHARLKVTVSAGEEKFISETTIVFSRYITSELTDGLNSEIVEEGTAAELLYFTSTRKVTRMTRVDGATGDEPLYYLQTASLQSTDKTVITTLKRDSEQKKWIKENISLSKFAQIMKIYNGDFDKDGENDLLVYGLNTDESKILYEYIFKDSHEVFEFDLLSYKNFPLSADELASIHFAPLSFKGKTLVVPVFSAGYTYPDEDNTYDLLDRVNPNLRMLHLYYLRPEGNELKLRAYDSVERRESIQSILDIMPWENINWESPFDNSHQSRTKSYVSGLISSGDEFSKKYFSYTITSLDEEPVFESYSDPSFYIANNSSLSSLSVEEGSVGQKSNSQNFAVQPIRHELRSATIKDGEIIGAEMSTGNYRDPIFNIIALYDNEKRGHLLESRYFIHYVDDQGQKSKLRINRESSFPGVQFSETLSPVVVDFEDNAPGAYVDSTLIFGNRLYTMTLNPEGELVRPLALSVDIPKSCVHVKPEVIDGKYNYIFLCLESGQKVVFKSLPMSLP